MLVRAESVAGCVVRRYASCYFVWQVWQYMAHMVLGGLWLRHAFGFGGLRFAAIFARLAVCLVFVDMEYIYR